MNDMYVKIMAIQKKMDKSVYLQSIMKGMAGLIVFCTFILSINGAKEMFILWLLSIPAIGLFLWLDIYFIKQKKAYEFEIYHLNVEDLNHKKEVARITGQALSDVVLDRKITVPKEEIRLPIVFYVVMWMLHVFLRIILMR